MSWILKMVYFQLIYGNIQVIYNLELRKEAGFSDKELKILSNENK